MKNRVFRDVILNLGTTFLVMFSIQILLYPEISKSTSEKFFGEFIFFMSIVNLNSSLIGGAISNVYLKNYAGWKMNKEVLFRYNQLIILSIIVFLIGIVFLSLVNIFEILEVVFSTKEMIIMFIIIFFSQFRIIFTTWIRAQLDYKKIFILNMILAFVYISGWWSIKIDAGLNVYYYILFAEFFFFIAFLFIVKDYKFEVVKINWKTDKILFKSVMVLLLSSVFYTLYKYVDRVIIGNLLSVNLIPIFYIANITGQIFSLPFNVISNVLFSYIAQKNTLKHKVVYYLLTIPIIIFLMLFLVSSLMGPILIKHLYPNYYESAIKIFWVVNLGNSLLVIDYLLRGFIIKFYTEKFKVSIDAIALIIFIFISIAFIDGFGIYSIAYGYMIGIFSKCLIDYLLVIKYYNSKVIPDKFRN